MWAQLNGANSCWPNYNAHIVIVCLSWPCNDYWCWLYLPQWLLQYTLLTLSAAWLVDTLHSTEQTAFLRTQLSCSLSQLPAHYSSYPLQHTQEVFWKVFAHVESVFVHFENLFSFLQQRKWRAVCLANSVSCFANDLSKHWKVQKHYTHVVHYSYLHIRSMCVAQCQHRMPTLYIGQLWTNPILM